MEFSWQQVAEAKANVDMKKDWKRKAKALRALKAMLVFHYYKKLVFAKCSVEWRFLK